MVGCKTKTPSIVQLPPSPQMVLCNATPLMSRAFFRVRGIAWWCAALCASSTDPEGCFHSAPAEWPIPDKLWEELARAPCGSRKERCFLGRFAQAAYHTFGSCKMQQLGQRVFNPPN